MKPSLQVRLSQHLALTPQLQQSIRLLQLSTLELHQEVEQMLEQNPFLETEDEAEPAFERSLEPPPASASAEQRARRGRGPQRGRRGRRRSTPPSSTPPSATTGKTAPSATTSTASASCRRTARRRPPRTTTSTRRTATQSAQSLQDHLRAQLAGMRLSPEDHAALRGADRVARRRRLPRRPARRHRRARWPATTTPSSARTCSSACSCALKWLQSLEPAGVGARDLAECLTLQLRCQPRMRGPGGGHHHLQAAPRAAGPARPEEADGRHRRRRRRC